LIGCACNKIFVSIGRTEANTTEPTYRARFFRTPFTPLDKQAQCVVYYTWSLDLNGQIALLIQGGQTMKETREQFVPTGAIAFFITLIIVYALVWFTLYGVLLNWR